MISPLEPDSVLSGLGDKFLAALVAAVLGARTDINEMRAWRPGWFPQMHSRVLSNLIHDRIWARLTAALLDDDTVTIVEDGPTREIYVGMHLLLRIKRHHADNMISTYPTQGALEFYIQAPTLPGMEVVTLAAGYRWDPELREIKAPVISYRDGKDNPIWAVELEEPDEGTSRITWTPILDPSLPAVESGHPDGEEMKTTDEP